MPLTRRRFLATAGAGAALAAGAAVEHDRIARAVGASPAPKPATAPKPPGGILVLVTLAGGNDGLNTLIPYADAAYHAARPTIGLGADQVIRLDADFGLHPNLKGLKALWDRHQLAIVRGVGHPDPTFSHFREMAIWQSGDPVHAVSTGWIGRYLDQTGGRDPLYALSLGPTLPVVLQGEKAAGSAVPSGTLTLPAPIAATFPAVERPNATEPYLARMAAQSGTNLLQVMGAVREVLTAQPPVVDAPSLETGAPGGGALATQLDLVARLITGGLPTRVYVVTLGGFDTHGGERATHDRLLTELDGAVSAFVSAVAAHPVVLMTFSEFGRRVAENASGGTDHGSAAPVLVAGTPVKGGYYGEQPSLVALSDGNLEFTTDFRSVYATVAGEVLGIDPKAVLEGGTYPTLGFV